MRAGQEVRFNDNYEISVAIKRDELRVQSRKIGESFLDISYNHKLKGQAIWKKFMEELSSSPRCAFKLHHLQEC